MQETIDAGDCVRCTANINLFEVGNARVSGYTRIVDGELVDEMLDVTFLRDFSTVNVVANGVGNVWAHTLEIIEGDLVDEMVDVEMEVNTGSVIRVDVNNIANARTVSHLIINNSELIDEVIDVGTAITQSTAVVNMRNSGNSYCNGGNMHTATVTNGELVDNIIEFVAMQGSLINITAYDSANIFTSQDRVHFVNSTWLRQSAYVNTVNSGSTIGRC